jgi:hypothetical protein
MLEPEISVIPAEAGIQFVGVTDLKINQINNLDSGFRRNDGALFSPSRKIHSL